MIRAVATSLLTLLLHQLQKQPGSFSHHSQHLLSISEQENYPWRAPSSPSWLGRAPVWDPVWDCIQGYLICRGFLPEARPEGFLVLTSEWDFFTREGYLALGSLSCFHVNNSVVCVDVPPGSYRYTLRNSINTSATHLILASRELLHRARRRWPLLCRQIRGSFPESYLSILASTWRRSYQSYLKPLK